MEIQIREVTLKLLMLFPIFTLLAFVPAATTILALLGFAGMTFNLLQSDLKKSYFLLLVTVVLLTLWNYGITEGRVIHTNEIIYFLYLCLFTAFLAVNTQIMKDYLIKNQKYIKNICNIWCVFVIVSLFLPLSYDDGVFMSFAETTFRLSPSAVMIMAFSTVLIAEEEERSYSNLVYTFIALLAILLGASRTYLVIGALMTLLNVSMAVKKKSVYFLMLILLTVVGLFIIINSSMGEKFISSVTDRSYQDPLAIFTNGRSDFWIRDLEEFNKQPYINRLLGCGFNFVRIINGAQVGTAERGIWAHNDFIQILLTYGYLGLFLYIVNMRIMFKKLVENKLPFLISVFVFIAWLFNATFNMYFTYTCSMLALPITLIACDIYKQKNELWFEKEEI